MRRDLSRPGRAPAAQDAARKRARAQRPDDPIHCGVAAGAWEKGPVGGVRSVPPERARRRADGLAEA